MPGGQFKFTVRVSNPGLERIIITSPVDDVYGNIADATGSRFTGSTCGALIGTELDLGAQAPCTFVGTFTRATPATETDVVTVVGVGVGKAALRPAIWTMRLAPAGGAAAAGGREPERELHAARLADAGAADVVVYLSGASAGADHGGLGWRRHADRGGLFGRCVLPQQQNDGSPPEITFTFGDPRGFPVVGDFNRDGTEDVAVYRNGLWQVRLSTGDTYTFTFGTGTWPATIPVAGDWDGDAIDGIGTYTYATATWALRNSPTGNIGAHTTFAFGTPNASYPVPGDWNANGDDTVGVKTGTTWSLRSSNTPGPSEITFDFGGANDLPLTWKRAPAASATLTLALRQAASGGCTITLTGAGREPNSHVSDVDTRYDEQPALSYQVDGSGSITADTSQGGLGAPFTQGPATSTTAGGNPISSNTVTCP